MKEIIVFSKLEVKRSHQERTLDRSWGYDSPSFFFFFAIEGHVVTPNRLFSRVNRGFCFPLPTHYRDGMRCLSFALARHGPRHGFSSSYPCRAAYYGRVPSISTRAIALLHRCMCAPRLIAQVTGTIFVDLLSFYRVIRFPSEQFRFKMRFLPVEILLFLVRLFFFFWTILLNFISESGDSTGMKLSLKIFLSSIGTD